MTPNDLAQQIAPQVREAAEVAKPDILANLPPIKRFIVRIIWSTAMKDVIPAAILIMLEYVIIKYRAHLEQYIGETINALINVIDEKEENPKLKTFRGIIGIIRTPHE